MLRRIVFLVLLFVVLPICIACSQGSSSDDDSSDTGGDSSMEDTGPGFVFSSRCGAVIDNVIVNPVPSANLEEVSVEVLRYDILVITRLAGLEAGNQQLVKIHGISSDGLRMFQKTKAENIIRDMTAGGAFFAKASTDLPIPDPETGAPPELCETVFPGGGVGTVGQLFTRGGQNIAEVLIQEGAAEPVSEVCNSSLLLPCYTSIEPREEISPQEIGRFLWKPVAERDGNLVVLVDASNITIVVTGALTETLFDFGPSNGFGTTARSAQPGAAFGGNISVTFFDSEGRPVLLRNGERQIIIPNGSQRVELSF